MKKIIRLNSLFKNYSSETEVNPRFFFTKNKCKKYDNFILNNLKFCYWFIGFTEGDGCFNVYTNIKSKKIIFTFKISQKINNCQVLYFMCRFLKCGSVRLDYKYNMAHFLIRDSKSISSIIIPLFNQYWMFSVKELSFLIFKKSFSIWKNTKFTQIQKILIIENLKYNKSLFDLNTYKAQVWSYFNLNQIPKPWIIGFIEAEGSFYLTHKDSNRLVHAFGITQKFDKIILDSINIILNSSKSAVKFNKKGFYSLDIYNKQSLKFIKCYFNKQMKGRKSFEFKVWSRSFKDKGKYHKLIKINKLLYKIRTKV